MPAANVGPVEARSVLTQVVRDPEDRALKVLHRGLVDPAWTHADKGQNLMFFAAARSRRLGGSEAIARRLYELGVAANDLDDLVQMPLYYAAREGNLGCCEFLVELKCNVNHRDWCNQSPLFYAAREGHVDVCRMLLQAGGSVNLVDKVGRSAVSYMSTHTRKALGLDGNRGDGLSTSIFAAQSSSSNASMLPEGVAKMARKRAELLPGHPNAGGRKAPNMSVITQAASSVLTRSSGSRAVATISAAFAPCTTPTAKRRRTVKGPEPSPGENGGVEQGDANTLSDLAAFLRYGYGSTPASVHKACSSAPKDMVPPDCLVGADCGEHGTYYVAPPLTSDVLRLRAIEREFVTDHAALFEGTDCVGHVRDWCGAVNVILDESEACRAISRIVKGETQSHTTLQCVHVPNKASGGKPLVVGYVHFVALGEHIDASHLKVVSSYLRRGLGALLLAGMVRHVENARGAASSTEIRLVVMSRNIAARQLYHAVGFEAVSNVDKPLGKGIGMINWTRMRRFMRGDSANFIKICIDRVHARSRGAPVVHNHEVPLASSLVVDYRRIARAVSEGGQVVEVSDEDGDEEG